MAKDISGVGRISSKEYNGYKAYWDDGAQVLAPHDKGIIDEVNKIASAADIKFQGNPDLIQIIGEDVDKIYLDRSVYNLHIFMAGDRFRIDRNSLHHIQIYLIDIFSDPRYRHDADSACTEDVGIRERIYRAQADD